MKLFVMLSAGLLILHAPLGWSPAAEARASHPAPAEIRETSEWLKARRRQYETTTSDLSAADLKKIDDLSAKPSLALAVIDELIALAEVREAPHAGTELFAAHSFSPVARVLAAIGRPALPKINSALSAANLPIWSDLVLKDARRVIREDKMDFDELLGAEGLLLRSRPEREAQLAAFERSKTTSWMDENKSARRALHRALESNKLPASRDDLSGRVAGELFERHDAGLLLRLLAERISANWCAEHTQALRGIRVDETDPMQWRPAGDSIHSIILGFVTPISNPTPFVDLSGGGDPRDSAAICSLIGCANPFPRRLLMEQLRYNPSAPVRLIFMRALSRHEPGNDTEIEALLAQMLNDKRDGGGHGDRVCDMAFQELIHRVGGESPPMSDPAFFALPASERDRMILALKRRLAARKEKR